jgi:two-component system sensor histidine kinase DctS
MLHRTARLSALAETTSALAHEINQPLMAIASYNDACQRLLTSETPDRTELLRALEKARAQAIRAANILTRMREFVRSKQPQPVLCELNETVREALELLETRIEHEGVVAEVDLAEHLPPLLADRFLLVQVVVNLLENAVDAMRSLAPPRRRLTVSTERQGDRAVGASIADSGSGIPAAIGERLGTPFLSTKPQGLGLGLSICRSVVEAHGGRLWHSPNPEGGTIFHFTVAAEAG